MGYERVAPLMGQLWSPVAAVTSHWAGKFNAQIAVTVGAASIVPDIPRVVVQIYKRNHSHRLIYQSGAFALNFLLEHQLDLVRRFGFVSGEGQDKLLGLDYDLKSSGCPVLRDCWGYLDCRVINAMDGGDMTCFLGEVLEGDIINEGQPLSWRSARRKLPAGWLDEWTRKQAIEIEHSTTIMGHIDYTPWKPADRQAHELNE